MDGTETSEGPSVFRPAPAARPGVRERDWLRGVLYVSLPFCLIGAAVAKDATAPLVSFFVALAGLAASSD